METNRNSGLRTYTFGPKNNGGSETYVFVREWNGLAVGNKVSKTHDCIYYNGGLQSPENAAMFNKLIEHEKRNGFYFLRPDNLIYNKC